MRLALAAEGFGEIKAGGNQLPSVALAFVHCLSCIWESCLWFSSKKAGGLNSSLLLTI